MKAFKILFLLITSLVALFLLAALILPKYYSMEKSILIQAPVDSVYAFISDLNRRPEWDPWLAVEPEAQIIIFGNGEGSRLEWNGEVVGKGRLTIERRIPNKTIISKIIFLSPQQSQADIAWTFEPAQHAVKVTWEFSMALTYPFNRYGGFFMGKYLEPFLSRGLEKIQAIMETRRQPVLPVSEMTGGNPPNH